MGSLDWVAAREVSVARTILPSETLSPARPLTLHERITQYRASVHHYMP